MIDTCHCGVELPVVAPNETPAEFCSEECAVMCYQCGEEGRPRRGIRVTATDQDGVVLDSCFMCAACYLARQITAFEPLDLACGSDPWRLT